MRRSVTTPIEALPFTEQHLVRSVTAHLTTEFTGTFGPETIERFVADSLAELIPSAKVTSFLPLLAERFARERLRALAKVEGLTNTGRPAILFLCVHNAGRSQMAAGWLRHIAGDRIDVYSAGSEPASEINTEATSVMAELGVDITQEFPKPWTDEVVRAADVVITMGCGDACPLYPGKRYEDWDLDDPAGQDLATVTRIRDDICQRIDHLLTETGW